MTFEGSIDVRVRYNETDGQGRVHHAQYLNYFERGRVELLRDLGFSYRDFEAGGLMLVVAELNVRYLGAAVFDDILKLTTRATGSSKVRIFHEYELYRPPQGNSESPGEMIVTAKSTIACIDRNGKPAKLPEYLRS